ncbi:hypothetical protein F0267_01720 [Vibrio coralliilyticus]|uniref:Uncharacterized protein n=3 Tax=Vibrio TaxID=662 RepID=A0AAN0W0U1_9VIBR|nr:MULTISPECIES: hypothetical protein [Vibrio]CAH1588288.1 conserved hypothetical protein [Vibrio jasicida]AIW22388.1 hypothetical protein IX92_25290 [Vibrio coralliilyticus]MCZ2799042.1 hypothetical protein [Vibrio alginolyticus]NOH36942.1 hypothetical protein [Vibrio coralliilyticus]PAW02459.1 hypothetical protein CKJ79_17495 [Vibrio coralliilyticus]
MTEKLERDQVRAILKKAGITVESVTNDDLKKLRRIISKHLRRSGIYHGTAKLRRARNDLKYMEMTTEQWDRREAVSFNRDGFIGVAGWADDNNVQPLLSALVEWSEWMSEKLARAA